jgi:hypothetical protein
MHPRRPSFSAARRRNVSVCIRFVLRSQRRDVEMHVESPGTLFEHSVPPIGSQNSINRLFNYNHG